MIINCDQWVRLVRLWGGGREEEGQVPVPLPTTLVPPQAKRNLIRYIYILVGLLIDIVIGLQLDCHWIASRLLDLLLPIDLL